MENPRHWRLNRQRYSLTGTECPHCLEKHFPPREVCPDCRIYGNNHTASKQPDEINQSAIVTCPIYNGDSSSYLYREVRNYSEMIKSEIDREMTGQEINNQVSNTIEINVLSGVIYQNSGVAV